MSRKMGPRVEIDSERAWWSMIPREGGMEEGREGGREGERLFQ